VTPLDPHPITIDGFAGCYTDTGRGPTVVLMISPFARAAVYERTTRALETRFRVLTLELPGCGCGADLNPPWDFPRYAAWAASFLRTLDLTDVTLIGHSNSAAIATFLAAAHPDRLARLALVDSVGYDPAINYAAVFAGCAICGPFEPHFVVRLIPNFLGNLRRHPRTIARQLRLAIETDMSAVARAVRVPTLIAWGGRDTVTRPSVGNRMHALIPHAHGYTYPLGNHDWLVQHPDVFTDAVADFVRTTRQINGGHGGDPVTAVAAAG
jgi:pimeloyl-ACP methyl ester carboxylesterase